MQILGCMNFQAVNGQKGRFQVADVFMNFFIREYRLECVPDDLRRRLLLNVCVCKGDVKSPVISTDGYADHLLHRSLFMDNFTGKLLCVRQLRRHNRNGFSAIDNLTDTRRLV